MKVRVSLSKKCWSTGAFNFFDCQRRVSSLSSRQRDVAKRCGIDLMTKKNTGNVKVRKPVAAPPRKRSVWTRADQDRDAGAIFGSLIRSKREERQLTLLGVSKATGITTGTLSRIENSKMAPTFAVVLKLLSFYRMEWPDFIATVKADSNRPDSVPFFSVAEENSASSVTIATGTYTFPHGEKYPSPFLPLILEVTASRPEHFGGLAGHPGVEFCYVLEGNLELHVSGQLPVSINQGGSVFFDSTQAHAYVAKGGKPVKLLIVSTARIFSSFTSSVRNLASNQISSETSRSRSKAASGTANRRSAKSKD